MSRTLIAGGTGFIGQQLAIKLAKLGHEVIALGTSKRTCSNLVKNGVKVIFTDLSKTPLASAVENIHFEYVINLSGYIDHSTIENGGLDVFKAHTKCAITLINGVDRNTLRTFVQIGTSDEYGDTVAPQSETAREQPVAPYSLAKLCNTHLIQMLARNESFPGVVVRPFLVYGPGQSLSRLIPFLIQQSLNDRHFDTSPGEQLRDFLYIDDFCDGVISLFDQNTHYGKIFNIASGEATSVRKVIETVIKVTGGGIANFGGKPYRVGESMALYANIEAITAATGWRPKTSLQDGLRLTTESIRSSG